MGLNEWKEEKKIYKIKSKGNRENKNLELKRKKIDGEEER